MLVDSHVHLDMNQFKDDLDDVIARARAAGVGEMLQVCYDARSVDNTIALTRRYADVYGALGIHPHDAKDWDEVLEKKIKEGLLLKRIVAVGETGLDYYRDLSPRERQREVFRRQIGIALYFKKPIVVHSREAFADTIAILREEGASEVGGIFHAFPGGVEEARQAIDLGFLIGIGGPLTYKNSRLPALAKILPSSAFVLETDCPYLPPELHRGTRNEPARVAIVRDRLAAIRGAEPVDVERAAESNYARLIHKKRNIPGAVAYTIKGNIYINVTRACTNNCTFCLRNRRDNFLYGYNLNLAVDPTASEMVEAATALAREGRYGEIVFCGYGEPTCRTADLLEAARALKSLGLPLRLDTNGHGNMINRRDIVPELAEVFDGVSVSLNAHDRASYARLCRPDAGEKAFDAVLDFLRRAAASRMACTVTVLDYPGVDVEACRALVSSIPRARFRVRTYYME
ncbi:MAG: YchF/TatD family DNA exonuclease [Candidatus Krumholzibacteria bacterium]|nr:YchF/TatD family DNA exonuclease [Candidatus Krumholzibacteria bacterium]